MNGVRLHASGNTVKTKIHLCQALNFDMKIPMCTPMHACDVHLCVAVVACHVNICLIEQIESSEMFCFRCDFHNYLILITYLRIFHCCYTLFFCFRLLFNGLSSESDIYTSFSLVSHHICTCACWERWRRRRWLRWRQRLRIIGHLPISMSFFLSRFLLFDFRYINYVTGGKQ